MNSPFQTIGIVSFIQKDEVAQLHGQLKAWLEKRGLRIIDSRDAGLDVLLQESDLIISLGGDGTILRIAGKMIHRIVPVLGINLGSLGFLTAVKTEETFDELKLIFAGQCELDQRMMLSAVIKPGQGSIQRRFQALNDIVIHREGLTRYMMVSLRINGDDVTRFYGDGIIIATPTGSTAYSLSAGGPIVHPELKDIIVTPICPHASAMRSLIVASDKKLEAQITCDNPKDRALLTADGQEGFQIDNDSLIEVTMSVNRFPLVRSSKRSYYGTLQEKFKIPI